jgi:AcrR family transcriptional regulator
VSTHARRHPPAARGGLTDRRQVEVHEQATGSPWGDRALAPRASILEAGRQVFEQVGFRGARMDDIARAAGTSRPLVYHYFTTKRDLFLEIARGAERAFRDVIALARALPDDPSVGDLESLARGFVGFLDAHGSVVSLWAQATWDDPELQRVGSDAQLRDFEGIGREISRMSGSSDLSDALQGMAVVGMIERPWYEARYGGMRFSSEELVGAFTHQLAAMARPG